jgi:hypothetical protein
MPPIKEDNILPPDFDGVFKFTNPSDTDFVGMWNKVAYTFPAGKTVPLIISGATPEDVQHIRKKFAKELAVREFYRSENFRAMEAKTPVGSGLSAAPYTDTDIAPYVQRCLEPLPEARFTAAKVPGDSTANYHADVTKVLDKNDLENRVPLAGNGSATIA